MALPSGSISLGAPVSSKFQRCKSYKPKVDVDGWNAVDAGGVFRDLLQTVIGKICQSDMFVPSHSGLVFRDDGLLMFSEGYAYARLMVRNEEEGWGILVHAPGEEKFGGSGVRYILRRRRIS